MFPIGKNEHALTWERLTWQTWRASQFGQQAQDNSDVKQIKLICNYQTCLLWGNIETSEQFSSMSIGAILDHCPCIVCMLSKTKYMINGEKACLSLPSGFLHLTSHYPCRVLNKIVNQQPGKQPVKEVAPINWERLSEADPSKSSTQYLPPQWELKGGLAIDKCACS